jgi:hypothetical protein
MVMALNVGVLEHGVIVGGGMMDNTFSFRSSKNSKNDGADWKTTPTYGL